MGVFYKKRGGLILLLSIVVVGLGPWAVQANAEASPKSSIVCEGSTTLLPLIQHLAEAYMKENPGRQVFLIGGGTNRGLKSWQDKTASLALISSRLESEDYALIQKKGLSIRAHPVATDAVMPVVHPANPVVNLNLKQLKDIFSGAITNWQQVDGPDMPITVYSHPGNSGTYDVWLTYVLEKAVVVTPAAQTLEAKEIQRALAEDPSGISYIAFGRYDDLRPLTVEGIAPTTANIIAGRFPITRTLLLISAEEPDEATADFLRFIKDPAKSGPLREELGMLPPPSDKKFKETLIN